MDISLRQISIRGLHGRMDITIPIKNNKLILVGINGLGKTTILNLLYFILSRQWYRLLEVSFSELIISVNDDELRITQDMLRPSEHFYQRIARSLPSSIRNTIVNDPNFFRSLLVQDYSRIESEYHLSRHFLRSRLPDLRSSDWQSSLFDNTEGTPFATIDKYLEDNIDAEILYLPTYRRIEHDLSTLLPHFEDDVREFISRQRHRNTSEIKSFIELVHFGMDDVKSRILERTTFLKERARVELNDLAGRYLHDVIAGDVERYDKSTIESLSENDVDRILSRIEERTLAASAKTNLRDIILDVLTSEHRKESSRDTYLVHFFSKLVDMSRSQEERESPLRDFTKVCNNYLQGKQLIFDDIEYDVSIVTQEETAIEMDHLSSGEKQIVSLFSHIYLGSSNSFFVVIDEPELSLSVAWQQTLLPDVVKSGRCRLLAAVTHSPFIFDNELEPYAVDLRGCIRFI